MLLGELMLFQKDTAACQLWAYGNRVNQLDEWIPFSEFTIAKCLHQFVVVVCQLFSAEYLQAPTAENITC